MIVKIWKKKTVFEKNRDNKEGKKDGEGGENKEDEKIAMFEKGGKAELVKLKKLNILVRNTSKFKL